MVRLRKPLEYYIDKYGTWDYGLQKMYLMMEKQHNRGQDGAGIAGIKLSVPPGNRYLFRNRSNKTNPIKDIFEGIYEDVANIKRNRLIDTFDIDYLKNYMPYSCDIYLGHLRYGTFGNYNIDYVHPVIRENNWKSRTLVMAGNFNLTNVDEVFESLLELGQAPVDFSDTVTILENVGHRLDEEVERVYRRHKAEGNSKRGASSLIEKDIDLSIILGKASRDWDGGYAMAGMVGHGDAFVMRDPAGIRPAFYYIDDEVVVAASERPVIQTIFNVGTSDVKELPPAHALIVKADGSAALKKLREPTEPRKCSFERIYFSRGTDSSIYKERKKLGEYLTARVLRSVDNDIDNTVFSYIPNTAESAFFGLIKGVEDHLNRTKLQKLKNLGRFVTDGELVEIINHRPRVEKIAVKDAKLRTFITEDKNRENMVGHVYDVTYGVVRPGADNLVVIDDSIVRGTTLKKSIIKILDRLGPKKIVVVSSAPQLRYPDCYGIDMAKMGDLIAFKAAIELLKDTGREPLINDVYKEALEELKKPISEMTNVVCKIYQPFTDEEISAKISRMLKDKDVKAEIEVVYQSVGNLHKACPGYSGDWYFTGRYPTPGGNRVVNRSFVNYMEGRNQRAY
jgi:amidophosphoribosyltransferase